MSSVQIVLDKQLCILANPRLYPEANGKADGFLSAIGPLPGRGYVLMDRDRFGLVDKTKPFEVKFRTDTEEKNAVIRLKNMFFVSAKRVTVGREGVQGIFMVEFADRRILAERFSAANRQFNVRKEDPTVTTTGDSVYTTESLNGSVSYTWQTMIDKLWSDLPDGFGTAPTLPFSPDGKPENWVFIGSNLWEAITVVLDKIQVAVNLNPLTDKFSFVRLGNTQTDLSDAEKKAAQVPSYMKDSEPSFFAVTDEPETIRVYFPKRFAPWSTQPIGFGVETVDIATNITGVSKGTVLAINDDLPALVNNAGTVTNSSALTTRATELASNWKSNRDTTRGWRKFPGVLSSILPGEEVKAVWWHYFGPQEGLVTEVAKHPGRLEAMTDSGPRWATLENIAPPDFSRKTLDKAPPFFPAETDEAISKETSGTVNLFEGAIGSEVDSIENVTAFNWSGGDTIKGEKVLVHRNKDGVFYFTKGGQSDTTGTVDLCPCTCAHWKFDETGSDPGDAIDSTPNKFNFRQKSGIIASTAGKIGTSRLIEAKTTGEFFIQPHQDCFSIQQGGTFDGFMRVPTTAPVALSAIMAKQPADPTSSTNKGEWGLFYGPPNPANPANTALVAKFTQPSGTPVVFTLFDTTTNIFLTDGLFHYIALVVEKINATTSEFFIRVDGFTSTKTQFTPVSIQPNQELTAGILNDKTSPFDVHLDDWAARSKPLNTAELNFRAAAGPNASYPYGDPGCDCKIDSRRLARRSYSLSAEPDSSGSSISPGASK